MRVILPILQGCEGVNFKACKALRILRGIWVESYECELVLYRFKAISCCSGRWSWYYFSALHGPFYIIISNSFGELISLLAVLVHEGISVVCREVGFVWAPGILLLALGLSHPGHLSFDHSAGVLSFKPKELGSLSFRVGGVHKFYLWPLKSGLTHPGCPVLDFSTSSFCSPLLP